MSVDQYNGEGTGKACSKARILFIDDSRFLRRFFTFVFEELRYEVETAPDGREGIRMAGDRSYDVVVVDGILPDMDGRDVCRHIHSFPGEKPIVVLYTASKPHFQDRFTAGHDGVDLCLKKDADGQLLVEKIAELLAERDIRRLKRSA